MDIYIEDMIQTKYNSPIGSLYIATENQSIKRLSFKEMEYDYGHDKTAQEAIRQLDEYFEGKRVSFDLKLEPDGTEFQKRCWQALLTTNYGETISYKEEALRIGNIKALRAVGQANHKNPIAIIIPCHRVIAANGNIGGYGGGIDTKMRLINLELTSLKKMKNIGE